MFMEVWYRTLAGSVYIVNIAQVTVRPEWNYRPSVIDRWFWDIRATPAGQWDYNAKLIY